MSHLKYTDAEGYGAWGDKSKKDVGYSQAVKLGDQIFISGQGGWNRDTLEFKADLEEEIDQAFENVDVTVKCAGGKGWADVYRLRSFHTPPLNEEVTRIMTKNLKKWCPNHQPIWTEIGVAKLGAENMRVEIEVDAHIRS